MEEKRFINYDKILRIKFSPMRSAGYYWIEPTPEKRIFFGLILKEKADEGGWSDGYSFINGYYSHESLLRDKTLMFVEENLKDHQWQERPRVTVTLDGGTYDVRYFDSNEKALEWVDEVISMSNNNIHII